MPTITVRLSGGLGNQLFQYAAGRAQALRGGATLRLDASSFASDPLKRAYALDALPIVAQKRDLSGWRRAVVATPGIWRVARMTGISPRVGGTRFLFDRLRGFDARIELSCDHLVLTGYWQDDRYFDASFAAIAKELDPGAKLSTSVRGLGDELASTTTLAIHVRRGDFAETGSPHGACPPGYYERAAQFLFERARVERVVVFSDDPAWARTGLSIGRSYETMAPAIPRSAVDDLWLMSRCQLLAISNSSYSWWAARLAEARRPRGETIIACPSRWYRPSAGAIPHPGPARWHRIAVD